MAPGAILGEVADSADSRAAFRRWARENHPDVGGDADVFAAGVAAMREGRWERFCADPTPAASFAPDASRPRVTVVPQNRAEVYVQRSARRVVKIYTVARRWNEKRKQPPRVR